MSGRDEDGYQHMNNDQSEGHDLEDDDRLDAAAATPIPPGVGSDIDYLASVQDEGERIFFHSKGTPVWRDGSDTLRSLKHLDEEEF